MSERETGAQSEQVTCHWQGQDGILRVQVWWCGDREKPTRVGQSGFCMVCGTGLGPCGTEQARCDVRPDPHDGLTPQDIARNASASIRLAIAAQSSELAITYAENAEGHVQRLMELAALSQSALAPAEWLAEYMGKDCPVGEVCDCLHPELPRCDEGSLFCADAEFVARKSECWLAAAITATGAAAESSKHAPAQVWPACVFVAEECKARDWEAGHLAMASGLTCEQAQGLMGGYLHMTPEFSTLLADGFGLADKGLFTRLDGVFYDALEKGLNEVAGAAAKSSAEEMLDALQSWADEHNQSISVYRGFARATRTDPAGTLPAFTRSNICDLAKALIAQAGGADRG